MGCCCVFFLFFFIIIFVIKDLDRKICNLEKHTKKTQKNNNIENWTRILGTARNRFTNY